MSDVPSTPPPLKKKGIPPIGWVGIGCGGILLIIVVGFVLTAKACNYAVDKIGQDFTDNPERTAAEMVVKLNPDIEKVSSDDEAGEISFRVKETGEEITVAYSDIQEGKWKMTSSDGTTTELGQGDLSKIPDWVPLHDPRTKMRLNMRQDSPSSESGTLTFLTKTSVADLATEYKERMETEGYEVTQTDVPTGSFLVGNNREKKRALSVQISPNSGQTQVALGYEEKK